MHIVAIMQYVTGLVLILAAGVIGVLKFNDGRIGDTEVPVSTSSEPIRPWTTCTSTSSGDSAPSATQARTSSVAPTSAWSPTPSPSTCSTRTPGQAARTSDFQPDSSRAPA